MEGKAYLNDMYDRGWGVYFDGTNWRSAAPATLAKAAAAGFTTADSYPLDLRGMAYSYAFVAIKNLGAGQFYLISIADKDGAPLDGSKSYRMNVPPNVPGRTVLVGDGLRPRDARPRPPYGPCQPRLERHRPREEP